MPGLVTQSPHRVCARDRVWQRAWAAQEAVPLARQKFRASATRPQRASGKHGFVVQGRPGLNPASAGLHWLAQAAVEGRQGQSLAAPCGVLSSPSCGNLRVIPAKGAREGLQWARCCGRTGLRVVVEGLWLASLEALSVLSSPCPFPETAAYLC